MKKTNHKKIGIASIIGAVLLSSGIGIYVLYPNDAEKVVVSEERVETEVVIPEVSGSSFENLVDIKYSVLSSEVLKTDGSISGLVLDVISSEHFSNDDLLMLENKLLETLRSEHDTNNEEIIIRFFESTEIYPPTLKTKDEKVEGLRILVKGKHVADDQEVKATFFNPLDIPELLLDEIKEGEQPIVSEGDIDAFSYNVKDVLIDGENATFDVIANGNSSDVEKFLIGFIQVTKELNSEYQSYKVNLYETEENFTSKLRSYQYDGNTLIYEEILSSKKHVDQESTN